MNKILLSSLCLSFILSIGVPRDSFCDDIYTFVVKKEEVKSKYRWSLSDWLETRDRMRLQDLWLAIHSPSPYEYFIGANYQLQSDPANSAAQAGEVFAAAYASILGLEARYEFSNYSKLHGLLDLRIFGFHNQGTNITLQGGIRSMTEGDKAVQNAVAGVNLTLYLAKYFGVEGLYWHYFPSSPNSTGESITANRLQGGGFIDFKFLRVYANYFNEKATYNSFSGLTIGTKIYF